MIPALSSGLGKGEACKAIHKQILRHLPSIYMPILRHVSKSFHSVCVGEAYDFNVPKEHVGACQQDVLKQVIKADDRVALVYYKEQMHWDISGFTLKSLKAKCTAETVVFCFTHDYALELDEFQDACIEYNRKDVFLLTVNRFPVHLYSLVYEAVNHLSLWPIEWMIATNQIVYQSKGDLIQMICSLELGSHDDVNNLQPVRAYFRSLIVLFTRSKIDWNAVPRSYILGNGKELIYYLFNLFVDSKRENDYVLFYEFYNWMRFTYENKEVFGIIISKIECQKWQTNETAKRYLNVFNYRECECQSSKFCHRSFRSFSK
jgi:hypothetical protein